MYIPQYAIKGPVYLESKTREVLYCGKLGPVWDRGVVTKRDSFVKVETLSGSNMYRLFDHVTVGIQLRGELRYLFLSNYLCFVPKLSPLRSVL